MLLTENQFCALTDNGLTIKAAMDFERYCELGKELHRINKGIQWAIGDWLAYGEEHFSEQASQAYDAAELDPQTAANYRWVARRFPKERRRPRLSFSHHSEAGGIKNQQVQDKWLDKAEDQGLSVKEFRQQLADAGVVSKKKPEAGAEYPREVADDPLEDAKKVYLALSQRLQAEFRGWISDGCPAGNLKLVGSA